MGGLVFATAVLATIPWLIAQPATRWNPKLQTRQQKATYRRVTAVAAITLTALALPTTGGTWLIAVGAAFWLDFYWLNYARTARGKQQLIHARYWAQQDDNQPLESP